MNKTQYSIIAAVLLAGVVTTSANAELTIYQVENNPPGGDSGHEWLTLINTGAKDTFSGCMCSRTMRIYA